jgi:hypothetical protein
VSVIALRPFGGGRGPSTGPATLAGTDNAIISSGTCCGTVVVHACLPVAAPGEEHEERHGLALVDLPAIETAATIVHRGSMDDVVATEQVLARRIEDNDHRATGYARELYLDCPRGEPGRWVTELQTPIEPAITG